MGHTKHKSDVGCFLPTLGVSLPFKSFTKSSPLSVLQGSKSSCLADLQLEQNVDDPKDSVDQQLSQKQSLDPRCHTGTQVFELLVPPEL